jgi:hypothetical protein
MIGVGRGGRVSEQGAYSEPAAGANAGYCFPYSAETHHMKRLLLRLAVVVVLLAVTFVLPATADKHGVGSARLQLVEATIQQLQKALQTKLVTSEQLVALYQARMAAYEDTGPHINAYIHVNADADASARQVDALRRPGAVNGPLYGIPILLKDNIDTADMPTTAGSVALVGSIPPDDAFIVQKLRQAGAIILGKGTLTEYANFIASGMPTGTALWAALDSTRTTHAWTLAPRLRLMTVVLCCRPEARVPDRVSASMRT